MFEKIKTKIKKLLKKRQTISEKFEAVHKKLEHKKSLLKDKSDADSLKQREVLENLIVRTKKLIIKYK
ncbi:MAG: hypothetical protein U9Q04_04940 [Campylobacterota bacterium]|nr:hypothetical protein [Campylobacterota bacterium]